MCEKIEIFDQWAIVELLGHRTLTGHVTEVEVAGMNLLRVDVFDGDAKEPKASPMFPPTSIYCLTPCAEEIARKCSKGRTVYTVFGAHIGDIARSLSRLEVGRGWSLRNLHDA